MAKEITRDGITYRVAKTFTFDEAGNVSEHEGGEITDEIIDSILEKEREEEEHEEYWAQLEREEYETTHLSPEEKRALKHAKKLL